MNSSSSSASGRSAVGGSHVAPSARATAGRAAAFEISPAPPPAHPTLKWLAIGGWATFAAAWLMMMLVLATQVGGGSNVNAQAAPVAVAPGVRTPAQATPNQATPRSTAATSATPTTPATSASVGDPRVLGLDPGSGHTVIVLDAIEKSRPWLDRAKVKLIKGLSQPGAAGDTFSVAVVNDNVGRGLINRPLAYGPAAAGALRNALNPLRATGTKGLGGGLDAAGKLGADQIVFITSRDKKWGSFVPFLEGKLTVNGKRIRLHVVQVNDQPASELRSFVTGSNGGTYLQVPPGSI